jgi:hypothetical protein
MYINHMSVYSTQNDLLMTNLLAFYNRDDNLHTMLKVVAGETRVSLRIVDWFVTNYAKKYYTVYNIPANPSTGALARRFKVYCDYKLKLKAYSKKRFDPFCRWDRISIPYTAHSSVQTTIGQLNFFKWIIEDEVIPYIEEHYEEIEDDMNSRNSTSKKRDKKELIAAGGGGGTKTRKKREELSISATKSIKTENVEIVVSFS